MMPDASRLIGRWKSIDPWQTEVHFEISYYDNVYSVRAIDGSDGEVAEVYDVKVDGDTLTFAALWSSGQFTKYRLKPLGEHIEALFTYNGITHFMRDDEGTH